MYGSYAITHVNSFHAKNFVGNWAPRPGISLVVAGSAFLGDARGSAFVGGAGLPR
jgi:hypothetical protein